ncbi:MAG: glycine betaine ABC transporter substrate-binding protein [Propionibacteriaceae bacterium]
MRFRRSKAIGLMAAAASVAIVASGCAISSGGTSTSDLKYGSIKAISGLKGVKLVVGSKDFDEQLLLGQIAINALKAAGATPVDKTNIQGTNNARQALTSGNIDLYYDYTGTGWIDFL